MRPGQAKIKDRFSKRDRGLFRQVCSPQINWILSNCENDAAADWRLLHGEFMLDLKSDFRLAAHFLTLVYSKGGSQPSSNHVPL